MKPEKLFANKLKSALNQKVDDLPKFPGTLGDGNGNLFFGTGQKSVYVVIGNQVNVAKCARVDPKVGKKVWVGYANEERTLYQILSYRNDEQSAGGVGGGIAPANRYRYLASGGGQDPLWLEKRAWLPLRPSPTPPPSMLVSINAGEVWTGTEFLYIAGQSADLTAQIPSTSGKAAFVMLTVSTAGTIVQTKGSEVDLADLVPDGDELANCPAVPADTAEVICLVRVYEGQTEVREGRATGDGTSAGFTDFIDLRGEFTPRNFSYIDFDLAGNAAPETKGRLSWNPDEATLDLGMGDDITAQLAHEIFFSAKNQTGSNIAYDTPVMFAGTVGASGRVLIQPAIADGSLSSEYTMGITTHAIDNGDDGKVTRFGKVRGIDTTGTPYSETWADGDLIWVSQTTAGYLTNVEPTSGQKILVAAVIYADDNVGCLLVRPTWYKDYVPYTVLEDTKDPTGWLDPDGITVSYNSTTRKITLTGTLDYYWHGRKYTLASPWTSDAHADVAAKYFLYSTDGAAFTWSTDSWEFYELMVAKVNYGTADKFGLRETHGLMPWQVHEELHETISAFRESGGELTAGTYAENTATDAANSPGFDAAELQDEDLHTTIPAWIEGTYTTMRIGASSVATFDTTATLPFRHGASYIYYNTPSTGAETAAANNRYLNVYQILVPATADTDSQKYRMLMLQPQAQYTSLAAAQAEDPRILVLGDLTATAPEFVIYARITYVTASGDGNNGKCRIATGGITYLAGTKLSQVSVSGFVSPTAENVPFSPSGTISATNVQAAIEEVAAEAGGGSAKFQRNLSADLSLADGECLTLVGYINLNTYALQLSGDAELQIL